MFTCSPLMANAIRQMLALKAVLLVAKFYKKKKKKAFDPDFLSLFFVPVLPLFISCVLLQ